jgi:hypothetical protein
MEVALERAREYLRRGHDTPEGRRYIAKNLECEHDDKRFGGLTEAGRVAAIQRSSALTAGAAYPSTIMRAFISRMSVKLVMFASRLLRQAGE